MLDKETVERSDWLPTLAGARPRLYLNSESQHLHCRLPQAQSLETCSVCVLASLSSLPGNIYSCWERSVFFFFCFSVKILFCISEWKSSCYRLQSNFPLVDLSVVGHHHVFFKRYKLGHNSDVSDLPHRLVEHPPQVPRRAGWNANAGAGKGEEKKHKCMKSQYDRLRFKICHFMKCLSQVSESFGTETRLLSWWELEMRCYTR